VIRNSVTSSWLRVIGQFGLGWPSQILIDHAEHRAVARNPRVRRPSSSWVNPTLIAGSLGAMYDFFFGSLNHVFLSSLGASRRLARFFSDARP